MIKVQAETRSKSLLAIEEISKEEGISVTDDDMEAEYSNIANMHNIPLEELRPRFRQEDNDIIKSIITSKKVFDYLLGAAKII
jgi:trigger factor